MYYSILNEYLLKLCEFHKSKARNKIEEACNIGNVVLIHKDNTP